MKKAMVSGITGQDGSYLAAREKNELMQVFPEGPLI